MLLELVVELVHDVPGVVQRQARVHHLDAQVVFLVDHDGDVLLRADGDAAGAVAAGELAGDELALDQELAVECVHGVDVEERQIEVAAIDGRLEVLLDLRLLTTAGPAGEREIGEVARQADPGAHHDVALGASAAKPFAGGAGQIVEVHISASLRRSVSRSLAASS